MFYTFVELNFIIMAHAPKLEESFNNDGSVHDINFRLMILINSLNTAKSGVDDLFIQIAHKRIERT